MTLVRYNPLTNFVPGTFGDFIENAIKESNGSSFVPETDIVKNDKAIELHLTVPGMSKKDFTIDLNDNKLKISGERKVADNSEYLRKETSYGTFSRVFSLSEEINTEKIAAKYDAGILKVTLPYEEKKINKATIEVK